MMPPSLDYERSLYVATVRRTVATHALRFGIFPNLKMGLQALVASLKRRRALFHQAARQLSDDQRDEDLLSASPSVSVGKVSPSMVRPRASIRYAPASGIRPNRPDFGETTNSSLSPS